MTQAADREVLRCGQCGCGDIRNAQALPWRRGDGPALCRHCGRRVRVPRALRKKPPACRLPAGEAGSGRPPAGEEGPDGADGPAQVLKRPRCPRCGSRKVPSQHSESVGEKTIQSRRCAKCGHTFQTVLV